MRNLPDLMRNRNTMRNPTPKVRGNGHIRQITITNYPHHHLNQHLLTIQAILHVPSLHRTVHKYTHTVPSGQTTSIRAPPKTNHFLLHSWRQSACQYQPPAMKKSPTQTLYYSPASLAPRLQLRHLIPQCTHRYKATHRNRAGTTAGRPRNPPLTMEATMPSHQRSETVLELKRHRMRTRCSITAHTPAPRWTTA